MGHRVILAKYGKTLLTLRGGEQSRVIMALLLFFKAQTVNNEKRF
jgi:hypothetical protein